MKTVCYNKTHSRNNLSKNKLTKNKYSAGKPLKHKEYINKTYSLITLNLYNTTLKISPSFNSNQQQLITISCALLNIYPHDILERLNILIYILSFVLSKIYLYFHYQACLTLYFWQTLPLSCVLGCQ
jgi:hypothetical protein